MDSIIISEIEICHYKNGKLFPGGETPGCEVWLTAVVEVCHSWITRIATKDGVNWLACAGNHWMPPYRLETIKNHYVIWHMWDEVLPKLQEALTTL